MKSVLVIGTRGSRLALWQAEWVKAFLHAQIPEVEVRIDTIRTSGDVMKDDPLAIIGGKGVFTKEIEEALLGGRIDVGVHSLKDLPTTLPLGLEIAAITKREDPRDALVVRAGLPMPSPSVTSLPESAIVGTSSPRRLAQLKHLRPDIRVKDLRGNVDTRISKLDAGQHDALILASAGLRRLGLASRISAPIEPEEMLPAVGQGALAIEARAGDWRVLEMLSALNDDATRSACSAERSFLGALGGGCQLPIAGHAWHEGERLRLDGLVAEPSGRTIIREAIEGDAGDAVEMGEELAMRLLNSGAGRLLTRLN
jgi:hydroxymethylbilane synthase